MGRRYLQDHLPVRATDTVTSMSGPKNETARDSVAMRWPSRQITAIETAGAALLAAIARARSASTKPSAPSATCANISE